MTAKERQAFEDILDVTIRASGLPRPARSFIDEIRVIVSKVLDD